MRRFVIVLTLGLLTVGAWPALAQQGQSSLQGRVVDESGAALPGVTLLVTHQGSGMFRQVVSNPDGSYYVTGVLPGPYRITADLTGFKKYERPDVLLTIGNTATVDITLVVGGIAIDVGRLDNRVWRAVRKRAHDGFDSVTILVGAAGERKIERGRLRSGQGGKGEERGTR